MVSAKFTESYEKVKTLSTKPSDAELLKLYAYAKVAQKEDIDASPKPGMFDLKGKAKRNEWQKVVDEGITPEQAEEKYIALVDELVAKNA
ncbi:acyl-CoA binding protein [Corynespora cassiicola Philippines]|uniref:Acyl-CoA binding protein n=1 Tax=Corynespora cassiicola Philippines TaxID=1448308 RepID=A0A2T2NV28_CORCC|nr:acyl-CoA binding protein [Corynespora cassiicola Philippines]